MVAGVTAFVDVKMFRFFIQWHRRISELLIPGSWVRAPHWAHAFSSDLKDVVKVENNAQHKHASKLHSFPFTTSTNTVGHYGGPIFDRPTRPIQATC